MRQAAHMVECEETHKGMIAQYTFSTSFLKLLEYKNISQHSQMHQAVCWLTLLPSHFPAEFVITYHFMCFTFQLIGFDQYFEKYQTPIQRILKGFPFPSLFLYRKTHRAEKLWVKCNLAFGTKCWIPHQEWVQEKKDEVSKGCHQYQD